MSCQHPQHHMQILSLCTVLCSDTRLWIGCSLPVWREQTRRWPDSPLPMAAGSNLILQRRSGSTQVSYTLWRRDSKRDKRARLHVNWRLTQLLKLVRSDALMRSLAFAVGGTSDGCTGKSAVANLNIHRKVTRYYIVCGSLCLGCVQYRRCHRDVICVDVDNRRWHTSNTMFREFTKLENCSVVSADCFNTS